jgi:uncharacterized protein YjbI with pentapeptide repeats
LTLRGEHQAGGTISDCDGETASLTLDGPSTWTRCSLRGARVSGISAHSRWDVVDLTGASFEVTAPKASFTLVSFRDGEIQGAVLPEATFVLCDFSGARLTGVDLSRCRFVGCDFTDAWLEDVDLRGADLRGCTFQGAHVGAALVDAIVEDANFRGASGLSETDLELLRTGGARTGGGLLHRLWAKALMTSPSAQGHRRVHRAVAGTWAAIVILLPVLFFLRAALDPVEPDYGPDIQSSEVDEEPEHEEPNP